jgi:hypothetical protein
VPHKTKSSERARRRREKWSAVRAELLGGHPLRVFWIKRGWRELYDSLYECMDRVDRERMDALVAEGERLYEAGKEEG